jgi:hypothetical protein
MNRNLLVLFALFVTGCSGADTADCGAAERKLTSMFGTQIWREVTCPRALSAEGEGIAQSVGAINGPIYREIIDLCRRVRDCSATSQGSGASIGRAFGRFLQIFSSSTPTCEEEVAISTAQEFLRQMRLQSDGSPHTILLEYADEKLGRVECSAVFPVSYVFIEDSEPLRYEVRVFYRAQYDRSGKLAISVDRFY